MSDFRAIMALLSPFPTRFSKDLFKTQNWLVKNQSFSLVDVSVGEPPPSETDESKQGWVSWAWSYVPQILPEEEDSGSQDSDSKPVKRKSLPSVFSIGMYAYKMSVIFKVSNPHVA